MTVNNAYGYNSVFGFCLIHIFYFRLTVELLNLFLLHSLRIGIKGQVFKNIIQLFYQTITQHKYVRLGAKWHIMLDVTKYIFHIVCQ